MIKLTAYLTNPSSSFKIEAFQPNGYDVSFRRFYNSCMISTLKFTFFNFLIILLCNTQDILHVGQITTEFGAGFDCSNTDLFEYASETSPSGLSRTKYTISHPWLLNGDGKKFMVEYLIPNKKLNQKLQKHIF